MLEMLMHWYRRRFTDPQAIALLVILLFGFGIIYFFNDILAPVMVAIVLAYLLEWPTHQLQKLGCSRVWAATMVLVIFISLVMLIVLVVAPIAWQQGVTLVQDLPQMASKFYSMASTLPQRYPALVDIGLIELIMGNIHAKLAVIGDSVVKFSLASLVGLVTLSIYLVLVPLIVFFLLKDKDRLLHGVRTILPRDRGLAGIVWAEMNQQITNYIRGKVLEMGVVGIATYLVFWFMGLHYALLLSVLVGISVLIPYIGAVLVTIPVVIVALFQWGMGADFWTLLIVYLIVQVLDGNVLVPLLFSEAVNLHPLTIILSVVIFGGLWGFWGVFFAIPLATLVKAVAKVWPDEFVPDID